MKPTDFLNEHNAFIGQEADEMHYDHELQMARADLYNSANYAIKLHKILHSAGDQGGLEGWVQEKITLANDYLRTVYEYLNHEAAEQSAGQMPAFAVESAEAAMDKLLGESASVGGTSAGAMAVGPVGAAAPVQRRVKKESAKMNYGNASKMKTPKFGKGVY